MQTDRDETDRQIGREKQTDVKMIERDTDFRQGQDSNFQEPGF